MGAIVVAALLATVFGLLPLGVYFNWVAGVHRRPQPVVLSGIADLPWSSPASSAFCRRC